MNQQRWQAFFENSPEWKEFREHLTRAIAKCEKSLIYTDVPASANPATVLADIRGLQREIRAYRFMRDDLPAGLTRAEGEEQPESTTEGSYATSADEGTVAGTDAYTDGAPGASAGPAT